jgi:hypothetical protein
VSVGFLVLVDPSRWVCCEQDGGYEEIVKKDDGNALVVCFGTGCIAVMKCLVHTQRQALGGGVEGGYGTLDGASGALRDQIIISIFFFVVEWATII